MVGAAIPDDVMNALMTADPHPQIQTHKLTWAVIHGIESTGRVVDVISTVATADYPQSKWLWSGYRKWDRDNGSDNRLIPFINVFGLKQLTRFLGCLVFLIRWSLAHRGRKRNVLLYGLISAHLWAVLCARLLFAMNGTVLITDLPGLGIPREPWWRRVLRPIDRSLINRAVQVLDGFIVLTRQIAEDYLPNAPAIVMEGILSVESEALANANQQPGGQPEEFVVLYAGVLQRSYGITMLLEAFAKLPKTGFSLLLLGRGDMEAEIRRRAEQDPRICFLGFVSPAEVFRRCLQATVLVNPRPSGECFTPYSFPSKILEYMAAGRPVITTRLPGIPAEYDPYVVWLDRETPEGLASLLLQLREQPAARLHDLGRRGREFVLQEKNYRRQGKRIVEFIERRE